jgi:LuxR family maltose regulon positive regulatory protein
MSVLVPQPRRANDGPLTAAEVEVLRYLPSQLSFEEIGSEIGQPRERVKSLAISAYRKMGVVSRAQAVHQVLPTPVR